MHKELSNEAISRVVEDIRSGAENPHIKEIDTILSIPFDKMITKIEPLIIDSSIIFTANKENAVFGNLSYIRVTADGVHDPSFGFPFQKLSNSLNYDNSLGKVNIIGFWFDGISYLYTINQFASLPQLDIPTNFSVDAGNEQNTLSWNAVTNSSTYDLNSHDGDSLWSNISGYNNIDTSAIIHSSLINGTEYFYRVRAKNPDNYIASLYATDSAIPTTVSAPLILSMIVSDASSGHLLVNFNEDVSANNLGYTFTVDSSIRTLSGLAGSDTSTLQFIISDASIIIDASLTLAYDASIGDTLSVLNSIELESFDASVVANNVVPSIIVMEDDFAGTTIDASKWTITDPADSVAISQNNAMLFDYDGTSTIGSRNNRAVSVQTINNGTIAVDYSNLDGMIQKAMELTDVTDSSFSDLATIFKGVSDNSKARLFLTDDASTIYDFETSINWDGNKFKIVRNGTSISFYYLSAPDTWTQLGSTQTVSTWGTTFYARLTAQDNSGASAGTVSYDNFYMTDADYATSVPA